MNRTTWVNKKTETRRDYFLFDASEQPIGRMATKIAELLMGKNRADYAPNVDQGNFVIVINADKLQLSGHKMEYSSLDRYSGYQGGRKVERVKDLIKKNKSKYVIEHVVRGMLPDNKLKARYMKRLKVYGTEIHPHNAQKPIKISIE